MGAQRVATLNCQIQSQAARLGLLQVADVIGVRALAVHAKDERAVAFYQRFGFAPSPVDPRHLFMIIKDIRLAAGPKP